MGRAARKGGRGHHHGGVQFEAATAIMRRHCGADFFSSPSTSLICASIEIVFNPAVVSYPAILESFSQVHDPTTYRSAIFYTDEQQKETAVTTIAEIEASGLWPGLVGTHKQRLRNR